MNDIAIALAFLFLLGFPWGLLTSRSWLFALVSSPLWTGLASSLVVTVSWVTATPLTPWILIAFSCGWLALFISIRRRGWPEDFVFHPKLVLPSLFFGGFTLLGLRLAPVGWDARSCWWFRAIWFAHGGDHAAQAFANPALEFACKDYPPFSSAVVAGSWFVSGSTDYKTAQVVSAAVTFSAVLLLILILRRLTASTDGQAALLLVPLLLGIHGVAGEGLTNGYNDLLWSVAFSGSVLCFLLGRGKVPSGLGPLLLAVAALSKQEGGVVALLLVVLLAIYRTRSKVPLLGAVLSLSGAVAWQVVVRAQGLESDMADFSFALLLSGTQIIDRTYLVLLSIWEFGGWVIVAGVFLFLISASTLSRSRKLPLAALPLISSVYLLILWAIYVFLSDNIEEQLAVTADRATVFPRVVSLVLAAVILMERFTKTARADSQPSLITEAKVESTVGPS